MERGEPIGQAPPPGGSPNAGPLLSPEELETARGRALSISKALSLRILGQGPLIRSVLVAFLSRGHVLLEGMPGLGKTALVQGLAQLLGLEFRRLQFTPDMLPSDITGSHLLSRVEEGSRGLEFHPGPVFTQVLLADEINRASPKTQSALLEAMQEGRVTVLGETRALPDPFLVLATQNPIELEGTYPLPEAQLDRFLFKLEVERVDAGTLEALILGRRRGEMPPAEAALPPSELHGLFAAVDRIHLPRAVANYIARLVDGTHGKASGLRHGASPRAAISMAEAGRAHALLEGRPSVGFDDVRAVAVPALAHRIVLEYATRLDGVGASDWVRGLLERVDELGEGIPKEMRHGTN